MFETGTQCLLWMSFHCHGELHLSIEAVYGYIRTICINSSSVNRKWLNLSFSHQLFSFTLSTNCTVHQFILFYPILSIHNYLIISNTQCSDSIHSSGPIGLVSLLVARASGASVVAVTGKPTIASHPCDIA